VNYGIRGVRDAVETGAPVGPLKDCLAELDARERTLEGELSVAEAPAPRPMPNLPEL